MKMKIAVFLDSKYGYQYVKEAVEWILADNSGYIRLTEIIDVDLPELPRDGVVSQQIVALEKEKAEVQADAFDKVKTIEAKIRDLQVICHEVQP